MIENLTIKKFHEGLVEKKFTAKEITESYFKEIEKQDKTLGAYLSLDKETALTQAKEVDEKLARGELLGMLAGIPIAVKDNILIQGNKTTAASKILKNYTASYDATVIKKLKSEQAVFLGKTNLDEFAMGASTENSAFGVTRNPYDLERVAGGSSGGSAAAVAADLALAALGSDTGGSIRQPASFCGVVGLRPTYGVISRYGLMAMASSLDQIGPITRTVEDAAILFNAIQGKDQYDSTSIEGSYEDSLMDTNLERLRKFKIGLPEEYFGEGIEPEIKKGIDGVIEGLKNLGIEFKEINLPHTKYAVAAYYIIVPAEVSSNLARYEGIRYSRVDDVEFENLRDLYIENRSRGFGEEVKRRIILGTFVLSSGYYDAYYTKAQKVRRLIKNDFDEAFKDVDVILTPTTPTSAFTIGEKGDDPIKMYLEDVFTTPASLAGIPALSIPVKNTTGLPIGFQLIGKALREEDILGIGQMYEAANS